MFSTAARVLPARALLAVFAAFFWLASGPGAAHAQATEPETHGEDEHAAPSRGGYAWGHEGDAASGAATPTAHHFARINLSIGAGFSTRIIQYLELHQERFAPPYLQLRGGYFFDGDGPVQHGVLLGIAPALTPDGTVLFGQDAFGQWTLCPSYMARWWLDGDLGDWLQLTGRIGVPLALGQYFAWGIDVGLGAIVEFLNGLGLYVEADFSMFFANDIHPLFSLEGGIVVEYEVLP